MPLFKQKINTNTFPGQTGTARAQCNLLSITLTWKYNLPVTVDDVVKHSASPLLRISRLLQRLWETSGVFVVCRICLRMLPALLGIYRFQSLFPALVSLMNFGDVWCFDSRLMLHDVTTKAFTVGTKRPAGHFTSQAQLRSYRFPFCTWVWILLHAFFLTFRRYTVCVWGAWGEIIFLVKCLHIIQCKSMCKTNFILKLYSWALWKCIIFGLIFSI